MGFRLQSMDDIQDIDISLPKLPQLCPQFFVSLLPEKPQDPIMDSLNIWRNNKAQDSDRPTAPENRLSHLNLPPDPENFVTCQTNSLWDKAAREPSTRQVGNFFPIAF